MATYGTPGQVDGLSQRRELERGRGLLAAGEDAAGIWEMAPRTSLCPWRQTSSGGAAGGDFHLH